MKIQQATAALYKERGVSPAGCLPAFGQMLLLIPLYSVFSQGLQNYNPQSMLDVFGIRILDLGCQAAPLLDATKQHVLNPCLNPNAFFVNWGVPEVFIGTAGSLFSGLSLLAIISSLAQFVASRMTMPVTAASASDDAQREDTAPDGDLPALHLADLRQHPAGRPLPLLDRLDGLLDRPAVPDHRLGRDVPDLRLDPRLRRGPYPALPGRRSLGADIHHDACGGSARANQD